MSNEVGISPVLLQAISQSLTPTTTSENSNISTVKMENTNNGTGISSGEDLMSKYIQQNKSTSVTTSDTIKTMLKIKMAANALSKSAMNEDTKLKSSTDTDIQPSKDATSDLAMANVLTAFASQSSNAASSAAAMQSIVQNVSVPQPSLSSVSVPQPSLTSESGVTSMTIGGQKVFIRTKPATASVSETSSSDDSVMQIKMEPNNGSGITDHDDASALDSKEISSQVSEDESLLTDTQVVSPAPVTSVVSDPASSSSNGGNPIIICYNTEDGSSAQNIVLSQNGGQIVEYGGKKYIIHTSAVPVSEETPTSRFITIPSADATTVQVADDSFTTVATQEVVTEGASLPAAYTNPCPICGDAVSGFHYGIFTCESCKGFFKRTVQNKKTFLCHRQGECEIFMDNRKKCPACRFAKCLVMGMKLEAIRTDRTRGGRSSYSGLSPLDQAKRKRPLKPVVRRPRIPSPSDSRLVTVLSCGDDMEGVQAYVPQILTDIMNLESLLCDDDIPSSISGEDFSTSDPNVFLTLLQLCELKLYKIVRWARNLPYFANISTDDQILLLQNCWCELLALTMCWKSLQLTNEIMFFHGQAIDQEKANQLDVGEMFNNLLSVVEHFRRLKLDQYECVALKVIILICPDIKGLNDADKLGEQQAKVSGALESYIHSHYQQSPSKFGEIILRLSELSRISCMLKDHLMSWMPPNTSSCGLLYELLKGENMKDLM